MKAKVVLLVLLPAFFVGCSSFVNSSKKTLYTATSLADGGMKTYAVYWKDQTNKLGDTAELELQRSNVMQISWDVGAGIAVADRAIDAYAGNLGTNTTTKAVVSALIATAISRAGSLAGYVGIITGNTNLINASH